MKWSYGYVKWVFMISGLFISFIRCFRVDIIFFEGGVRKIVKK